MNFEDIRSLIESKMATDWTTTPIEFENVEDSAALLAAKAANTPWIRVTIREGAASLISMAPASSCYRYPAVLFVQIFVKQGTGTATSRIYASAISDIWRGYFTNNVEFKTPSGDVVGELNGWFQFNVEVPFMWDDLG